MGTLVAGYLAGLFSTLSPCVLPLIPVLLASALQRHRLGPLALAGGLAVSFAGLGVLLAGAGLALGLDAALIRRGAAMVMLAFALVLLVPALSRGFTTSVAPLAGGGNVVLARVSGDGLRGQFVLGLVLGAVWSPCTGPTLGAAVGLAGSRATIPEATAVMAVFAVGAATPVLALAYGVASWKPVLARLGQRGKPILGAILLVVGVLVLSGADKTIEAMLVDLMPDWLITLTVRY